MSDLETNQSADFVTLTMTQLQPPSKDTECQIRLLNLLRCVLQDFNSHRDLKRTAFRLLDEVLSFTDSTYGVIAELGQGQSYAQIHALSDKSWDGAKLAYYQNSLAQGMECDLSEWGLGKPIIANTPYQAIDNAGFPDDHPPIKAFLGLPIYSDGIQIAWLGLANRPDGYQASWVGLMASVTETCGNLLMAARSWELQQQALLSLSQGLDEARQAKVLQDESITGISYELRALLNGILGHSQLLLMQELDADTLEQVAEIAQIGEKFAGFVSQLIGQTGDAVASTSNTLPEFVLPKPQQTETVSKPCRILVAEDEPANQAVLKMQLNVLGLVAEIAKDGYEALELWRTGEFDLILTDLNMPGISGLELTRQIRAEEAGTLKHTPIIGNTADHQQEVLGACLHGGMDDVLTKPIELEKLRQMLQSWLPNVFKSLPLIASETLILGLVNENPVLDMASLARITGGADASQIQNLVDLFATSARVELSLCRQYLLQKDASAIALAMHKLKSSAQTIGAIRFSHYAKRLEASANQADESAMLDLLDALDQALVEVETTLVEPFDTGNILEEIPSKRACCVLVVSDDAKLQRQITVLLLALGITDVLHCATRSTGLQVMREQTERIHLLLCDLEMPKMECLEFLRSISGIDYQAGIILMGDSDDDRLLHTAVTLAGLQGLHLLGSLCKPVSSDALLSLLNQPDGHLTNIFKKVAEQNVSSEDIVEGLNNNEFEVYFQPKVDTVSLQPVGVEALARWRRQGVIIPADAFIMAAERYGLIAQLSELLLIKAFFGGARLAAVGYPLTVSINLSAKWSQDLNLPDFIQASLHATGLKAENIVLEISETHALSDLAQALDMMGRFAAKGFSLSIDNFGVNCSSLERFKRLPLGELKLDRTFVQRAVGNVAARMILAANVDMAKKLNLTTVAEGVETQEELDLARDLGCTHVQGWFIGKAMPIDELIGWLYLNNKA